MGYSIKKSASNHNRKLYKLNLKQIPWSWILSQNFQGTSPICLAYHPVAKLITKPHLVPNFIMIIMGPEQGIFLRHATIDFFS